MKLPLILRKIGAQIDLLRAKSARRRARTDLRYFQDQLRAAEYVAAYTESRVRVAERKLYEIRAESTRRANPHLPESVVLQLAAAKQ